jgi:hypothetical protein
VAQAALAVGAIGGGLAFLLVEQEVQSGHDVEEGQGQYRLQQQTHLGQAQHDRGGAQRRGGDGVIEADGRLPVGWQPRRPPLFWFRRCCIRTRK